MVETVEAIPFTAWEQAVFVVLIIVILMVLLTWFGKQSDKWQLFIGEVDDKWRTFNKEQRECNNIAMAEVKGSLQDLTTVTQALVTEIKEMRSDTSVFFNDQDIQAKDILNEVKKRRPTTRSRAKAKVLPEKVDNDGDV